MELGDGLVAPLIQKVRAGELRRLVGALEIPQVAGRAVGFVRRAAGLRLRRGEPRRGRPGTPGLILCGRRRRGDETDGEPSQNAEDRGLTRHRKEMHARDDAPPGIDVKWFSRAGRVSC